MDMGCDEPEGGGKSGLGDLRARKRTSTIRLRQAEVERMVLLLTSGPQPFVKEIDLRLLIMRLAAWTEGQRGIVQATDLARERFLLPDGTLNPNVIVTDAPDSESPLQ
jgi:hypothetical protein